MGNVELTLTKEDYEELILQVQEYGCQISRRIREFRYTSVNNPDLIKLQNEKEQHIKFIKRIRSKTKIIS